MDDPNLPQIIVTVIAVLSILSPLLLLSYLAGRRSVFDGTNRHFDRIRTDMTLEGGPWFVEFDATEPDLPQVVTMELKQLGSRVVFEGRSEDGIQHSLEGIIFQRRLCLISIAQSTQGIWLGTVTAELSPNAKRLDGTRVHWSHQTQMLSIRKITFMKVASG